MTYKLDPKATQARIDYLFELAKSSLSQGHSVWQVPGTNQNFVTGNATKIVCSLGAPLSNDLDFVHSPQGPGIRQCTRK